MSNFWLDRPTFVTGASGLVGGWLIKRLIELKAEVVCLLRDWVPQSELVRSKLLERVRVVRGDVCNHALIERTLGEYETNTVIHLAAQTIVSIANRNPLSTFESNIQGTWTLLESCRRSPMVRQVVIASSDKAYGDQEIIPYTEATPLQGQHPYDVSKSCADLIAHTYATTYSVPVAITRCGNFFGGGDLNWNRIIPGTIRSILRGDAPIIRSDGDYIRDYFYVEDGIDAYLLLAEKLSNHPELFGQAFNFSYESHETVKDIVEKILFLMDSELMPEIQNQVTNEIRYQSLNSEKARNSLEWKPTHSLETGLIKTISWYRDFFHHE
jgi:CDP-glucose 4,6-dehydratase